MLSGKTKSGFEFSISEKVAEDALILRGLSHILKDDFNGVYELIDRMAKLGLDEDALYSHCTDEDGVVPIKVLVAEVMEILNSTKDAKNS